MLISVIMSVYNEPIEWVEKAIYSILNQSYRDLEFIIIIDNPNNQNIITFINSIRLNDPRVIIIQNDKNVGLTKSLNVGLEQCKGKYVVRMDADDISLPGRLQKQVKFMEEHPEIVASGSGIQKFGNDNQTIIFEDNPSKIKQNFVLPTPLFPPIAHPAAIIRADVLWNNNIRYNENYVTTQDYGLWNDLLKVGELSNLKQILLKYRVSDQQITTSKRKIQIKNRNLIIRDHISYYISKFDKDKYNVPEVIDLESIRELKSKLSSNKNESYFQLQSFILCYYLSLNNFTVKSFFFYIFNDLFNLNWSFRVRVKLLLLHFNSRFSKSIISSVKL